MQEEADIIIEKYSLKQNNSLGIIKIYTWIYNNTHITLVLAGIWKIQASLATSYLLSNNNDIDKIINIWIAGNLSENGKIWDVFIINQCHQHDMYLPFEWTHLDYAKKPINIDELYINDNNYDFNIYAWICATWDQFIDNKTVLEGIRNTYQADVVEMEAFAILSIAREYNMLDKCIVIKAISDGANSNAIWDHMNHLDFAMNNSIKVLNTII